MTDKEILGSLGISDGKIIQQVERNGKVVVLVDFGLGGVKKFSVDIPEKPKEKEAVKPAAKPATKTTKRGRKKAS